MSFDPPVVSCEIEYKYRRGVRPATTLRIRVEGKLGNKVARSVIDAAKAAGWPDVVDDICVVGSPAMLSPEDSRKRLDAIFQQMIEEHNANAE